MFSFLNIFNNSKPGADKKITLGPLSGKTLNLNSSEARALNIFNHKPSVSRKLNGNNTSFKTNCKANVTNPGFSFRIVQKAREIGSTTPTTDVSLLSDSCISKNSINHGINSHNYPRDDKKRKLMETLDNFGIRKRTRQECGVDTFVNRRRKTIGVTTDWVATFNGMDKVNNSVVPQIVINAKTVCGNIEKKLIKRHGDTYNHNNLQKRPRTRNNEILSSYSSSKFLLTPGQKRTYPNDSGDDDCPSRKHCKSCTCCGSTSLHNDKNPPNKSDKTTETDVSDDLVTVAASRIFNRSGKTQIVKRISMKTILDEAFDDVDPEPYTSIEKIEKKNEVQEKAVSINDSQHSSLIKDTNLNLNTDSVSTPVLTTSVSDSNQSNLAISFTSSTATTTQFVALPKELKEKSETDGKRNESQFLKNIVEIPKTNFNFIKPAKSISQTSKVDQSSKTEIINIEKAPFQFSIPTSKSIEPISSSANVSENAAVGEPTKDETNINQNIPVIQFGNQSPTEKSKENPVLNFESSPKQSTFTLETAKIDDKQSTPAFQFGAPKSNDKVLSVMQCGSSNVEKSTVPVMQFVVPKIDEKQPKNDAPNAPENTNAVKPVFSFVKNVTENKKGAEPIKFQFGGPTKHVDNISTTSTGTESKILFGSNTTALGASPFSFGKSNELETTTASDAPKFNLTQSTAEESAPKLQFGAMTSLIFGKSTDQTKTQLSNTVGMTVNNQDTKLVFGSLSTEVKPVTSTPGVTFNIPVFNNSGNNATSPVFQFSSTGTKRDEKLPESSSNNYQFSSAKTTPSFGLMSSPSSFVDKKAFEFNALKPDDQKTKFSTSAFGSQTAAAVPFKFGGNDKPTTYGSTFTSPNQTLQFNNKTETKSEPFKFNAPATASNTFQFGGDNKANSGPLKFGQNTNAFNPSGFNGFGTSVSSQPTPAFGSVSPPQPSPFGNVVASESTSSFGNVAPPSSAAFGSNGGFQFGCTNNSVLSNPSTTFGFGGPQPAKPESAFGFNAGPNGASPFQFGQTPSVTSFSQFNGGQPQGAFGFGSPPQQAAGIQGSGQALFSIGAAPAGERRKAKAVRRRNN